MTSLATQSTTNVLGTASQSPEIALRFPCASLQPSSKLYHALRARADSATHTISVEPRKGERIELSAETKQDLEALIVVIGRFVNKEGRLPRGVDRIQVVPKKEVANAHRALGLKPSGSLGFTPDDRGHMVISSAALERSSVLSFLGKSSQPLKLDRLLPLVDKRNHLLRAAQQRASSLRIRTIQAQKARVGQAGVDLTPDTDAPYGRIQGRPILGRDMPVLGSVYAGSAGRVLKVVAHDPDSALQREFRNLRVEILSSEVRQKRDLSPSEILHAVFAHVQSSMKYDLNADQIILESLGLQHVPHIDERKIDFNFWVKSGRGVCGDMAIYAAALCELLVAKGHLRASISFERSNLLDGTAHAWIRAELEHGEVYILDPAGKFIGRREQVPSDILEYLREEDLNYLRNSPQPL